MIIVEHDICRVCQSPLTDLFSLGNIRVSDFIKSDEIDILPKVPLDMCLCESCGLVQLKHTVPSDLMYRKYWYESGTNNSMKKQLKHIVSSINEVMNLDLNDVWLDIGSNDGTLLSFVPSKVKKIGIDPNDYKEKALSLLNENSFYGGYDAREEDGVISVTGNYEKNPEPEIVVDYFNKNAYNCVSDKKAKVITSIAMFYDLDDPNEFVSDIYDVLDDDGLWVIQLSYLPLMLKQLAFDNICHEHLEYYSLLSIEYLLIKHNFKIVDCQLNDTNGGSFRLYIMKEKVAKKFATQPHRDVCDFRIDLMKHYEFLLYLKNPKTYLEFFREIEKLRNQVFSYIENEKRNKKIIYGYGASTKGNTLLQFFGLNEFYITGIAEKNPKKYGLKTIGSNIPIYSEEYVRKQNPDYMLVLPWHFINEFKQRESEYLKKGKFIIPCPKFEIIA
jgi:SAM-dependent methyltransferase